MTSKITIPVPVDERFFLYQCTEEQNILPWFCHKRDAGASLLFTMKGYLATAVCLFELMLYVPVNSNVHGT